MFELSDHSRRAAARKLSLFCDFVTSGEAVPSLSRGLSDHSRRAAARNLAFFVILCGKIEQTTAIITNY
jgi:hypothetical protein